MKSSVTISLVPEARGGPFVFWDDLPGACRQRESRLRRASKSSPRPPMPSTPATLRKLLDDNGLALAAIGTGAGWVKHRLSLTSPDAGVRGQAKTFIRSIIDLAGPFGAPAIIGSMQGRHGDGVDRPTALASARATHSRNLANTRQQYGVPLIYEPLNRYETNLIDTVERRREAAPSAVDEQRETARRPVPHEYRRSRHGRGAAPAAGLIGHVHFVDSNRRPAGCGTSDFVPIAAALRETGYDGFRLRRGAALSRSRSGGPANHARLFARFVSA